MVALEYATLSVIAPKACANILWKDSTKELEAASLLRMQSNDLYELGFIKKILPEPNNGAHTNPIAMIKTIFQYLREEVKCHINLSNRTLMMRRTEKYDSIGRNFIKTNKSEHTLFQR